MKEIYMRRSIRSYTGAKVEKEDMLKLAKAAMNAPSARNTEPWQIVLLDDKDMADALASYNVNWTPLVNARQGMILCGDLAKNKDLYYNYIDAALAAQNVMLEAESMGLGTCCLAIAPDTERMEMVKEITKAPKNIVPVLMISVGIKKDSKTPNDKFFEEKIHYNTF